MNRLHHILNSPKYRLQIMAVATLTSFLFYNSAPAIILAEETAGGTDTTQTAPPPDTTQQTTTVSDPPPAETTAQDSQPQPTSGTDITNTSTTTNDVTSTADSGNNTIQPTPTPTPDAGQVSTTGDIQPTLSQDPQQEDPLTPESTGSGTEELQSPESGTESTQSAAVVTDSAAAVTDVTNEVNTTSVNSASSVQTVSQGTGSGDITVAPLPVPMSTEGGTGSEATGSSVLVTNEAILNNTIVSEATTGGNIIEGAGSATITTGAAASVVSLTNLINTTLINSILHIFTINIYGNMEGDVKLPEYENAQLFSCGTYSCSVSYMSVDNTAAVTNNVTSLADSGNNTITGPGVSSIRSGDAASLVSIINLINTVWKNSDIRILDINVFGSWLGDFLGWDGIAAAEGGQSLSLSSLSSTPSSCGSTQDCVSGLSVTNSASVTNTVMSSAVSGGNTIAGSGGGNIQTGGAISYVSILNMINTTLIDSIAAIGYINIFGSLDGDIGGASEFPTPTPTPGANGNHAQSSGDSGSSVRESGGQLDVMLRNNVGEFVYPGDTVTFFVTVKNPGSGRVYDTKLELGLFLDGQFAGMRKFDIGTIKPFGTAYVTTGLVLSDEAPPGKYTAVALVSGVVGPDDHKIQAMSYNDFMIRAKYTSALTTADTGSGQDQVIKPGQALGAETDAGGLSQEEKLTRLMLLFGGMVLGIQAVKRRKQISRSVFQLLFVATLLLIIVTEKVHAGFFR